MKNILFKRSKSMPSYKYCFVLCCDNSTHKTPKKRFITVKKLKVRLLYSCNMYNNNILEKLRFSKGNNSKFEDFGSFLLVFITHALKTLYTNNNERTRVMTSQTLLNAS